MMGAGVCPGCLTWLACERVPVLGGLGACVTVGRGWVCACVGAGKGLCGRVWPWVGPV